MGCFIGCLGGGDKDRKRSKQRIHRGSPRRQRNKFQNVVQQESIVVPEKTIDETDATHLVLELRTEPEVVKQQPSPIRSPDPSPKKRVTFNSNITTYEHVSVHGSIDSLSECTTNVEKENQENSKTTSQACSISEEDLSVVSSVASYPPNHRYHNAARDSDDETEDYGDSDLDDFDEEEDEDDDYDYDYDSEDEYIDDAMISGRDVWSESVLAPSVQSRTENPSRQDLSDNVGSPMILRSKGNARDRSDYINSVLNPIENTTQWKSLKSKGTKNVLNPQKENVTAAANFELPCVSLSSKPTFKKMSDQSKNTNQEIAVDASLSNWLGSSEITPSKKSSFSSALTVEELRQYSASNSPRKSPGRSPDETPIIGSVGTYWNHSSSINSIDSASSFKGIPYTTSSKYRGIY